MVNMPTTFILLIFSLHSYCQYSHFIHIVQIPIHSYCQYSHHIPIVNIHITFLLSIFPLHSYCQYSHYIPIVNIPITFLLSIFKFCLHFTEKKSTNLISKILQVLLNKHLNKMSFIYIVFEFSPFFCKI